MGEIMAEELEGMGMFEDFDIPDELNLEDAPEELKEFLSGTDDEGAEEDITGTPEGETENLNEDDSEKGNPEGVVEGEDQEEGNNQDDSPNLYSSFAAVLNEQGLLPSLDLENNKIEDVDSLVNAFKSELSNQAKSYIVSKLGEEGYDALEKGVTLSEYQEHMNATTSLNSITEDKLSEDIELSKDLIYRDYRSQGLSEARALRLLKKTTDLGEEAIIEDAKESLNSLKALEAVRLERIAEQRAEEARIAQQEQEQIDNDLKNAIYNSKEFIQGIKVDKTIQDKVYESITKVVGQSPSGIMENKLMQDRRSNPIEFDKKLYYLYEITNGFKDISKLVSKSESKAVNKLEQTLRQTNFKNQGGIPAYMEDPESYGGSELGSELVL